MRGVPTSVNFTVDRDLDGGREVGIIEKSRSLSFLGGDVMTGYATAVRWLLVLLLLMVAQGQTLGGVVSGRVEMPALCSTTISPAVVRLEPLERSSIPIPIPATGTSPAHFIDQRGMMFEPRVVAMQVGEVLRFGNADPDSHNVHLQGAGTNLNQVVAPGGSLEFVPGEAGVVRILCDVHAHMRAFVIVANSPWVSTCDRTGQFQFAGVPAGRYRLLVWHEMGPPLSRTIEVSGETLDLGTLVTTGGVNPTTRDDRGKICETGCEPWPLVIDRISVTLAESLDASKSPDSAARAVPLAQDAYYRDFESSGMGTAMRVYLGRDRATRVEELFRTIVHTTAGLDKRERSSPEAFDREIRRVLMALTQASAELNRKGVTERSRIFAGTSPAFWVGSASVRPRVEREGWVRLWMTAIANDLRAGLGAALALAILEATMGRSRRRVLGIAGGLLAGLAVALGFVGPPRPGFEGLLLVAASMALFDVALSLFDGSRSGTVAALLLVYLATVETASRNLERVAS